MLSVKRYGYVCLSAWDNKIPGNWEGGKRTLIVLNFVKDEITDFFSFYLGMIGMRNKGVENMNKIQPIKSDPLKENKGDLSFTDISWSMKIL